MYIRFFGFRLVSHSSRGARSWNGPEFGVLVGYIGVTVIRQQALACYQRIEFADLTYNFSSCFSFSSLWSPCLIFSSSHPCLCSCEGSRRRSQSRIRQTISTTNQRGERWRAHRRLWPAAGSAQPRSRPARRPAAYPASPPVPRPDQNPGLQPALSLSFPLEELDRLPADDLFALLPPL